ncbi:LacI family DNA-binding transcriptional regulator [Jeotgalibacillus proteolyticus]|uniref:LacI family transcriptional regulator n=1 Tax=Jeotgalibacillus proteolyticus TaxID=2082395 RepID=A0A2S5GA48_9BACL|nr:LacI family DNA-binding transcriptional regulator [Jeotgalibacillus proteolyticus]PPA69882.1 LacI family transcriptional regulator [Jeotgalibacillus proteolyticus]
MAKKVTMQAIADYLNISKNSVSQALSGKPGVSEETRKVIKEAADKLGYQYRTAGKNLSTERKNIGLIASDFAFSHRQFFGEIYLSTEKEATKRGMDLTIQSISSRLKDEMILPSFIENKSVDGLLILSHISTDYINKIISTGIPTVLIDHHDPIIQADAILTNNRFGAYTAVNHLIELGHQSIGFIGDITFSPSYQERWEGYKLALRKNGIEPAKEWMFLDAKEEESSIGSFIDGLNESPTAWFCVNDGLGFLISSKLQQKGIKIPDQASVVSFDNGQLSQLSTPKITTMGIDLALYGKKAVEQLSWRMENKEEPITELLLPATLIKRESTAKAPHASLAGNSH